MTEDPREHRSLPLSIGSDGDASQTKKQRRDVINLLTGSKDYEAPGMRTLASQKKTSVWQREV